MEENLSEPKFLKPLSDKSFRYISSLMYQHCGINLHEGKKELVRARLCARLRQLEMDSFEEYCNYLEKRLDSGEINLLFNILSTNLTYFFREPEHFEFLKQVLPKVIAQKKQVGSKRLRIWSAACSSGEEAYSLAIVVSEVEEAYPLDVKILATDISSKMLSVAQEGCYKAAKLQSMLPQYRVKYFNYDGDTYSVKDNIKKMVYFRQLNLNGVWPFRGPFDFIFCRNVLIYFDRETQKKLVNHLEQYLTQGGLLFVGHSESLISIQHGLTYAKPTIYLKP